MTGRAVYGSEFFNWDHQGSLPLPARFKEFPGWFEDSGDDPEYALLELPGKDGKPPMELTIRLPAALRRILLRTPVGSLLTIVHQGMKTPKRGGNMFRAFEVWNHDYAADPNVPPGLAGNPNETYDEWVTRCQAEAGQ